MVYVLSDIHGCFSKFMEMLNKINFSDNDILYILGDVVDRGPEPIKTLRYVLNHKNIKMLRGNHEEMMQNALTSGNIEDRLLWDCNGGDITYDQFLKLSIKEQNKIINFLDNLPNYFIVNNFLLVHAGINFDYWIENKPLKENIEKQLACDLLWIRDDFIYKNSNVKEIIIFGHTPTIFFSDKNPMEICYFDNRIGIDCGCVFNGGRLSCIRLNDLKVFYV